MYGLHTDFTDYFTVSFLVKSCRDLVILYQIQYG